jgi:hypothetical protein
VTYDLFTALMESNDLFDDPIFEEKTMNKLDHYDNISSHFSQRLDSYFKSTNEQSAPHYKAAERAWRLNPTDNPHVFPGGPVSPSVMRDFYAKCDAICERSSEPTTPAEYAVLFKFSASSFEHT